MQIKGLTLKVTPAELQQLRSLLQNPSDALKAYAISKLDTHPHPSKEGTPGFQPKADLSRGRSEQTDDNLMREFAVYPGKNILQAQSLFDILRTESQKTWEEMKYMEENNSDFRLPLLYGQMLQSIGIKVDFITNSQDELFLIFDSGRNTDEIGRITANRALVYPGRGGASVPALWIPVSISDISNNFTYAWYKGSQMMSEHSINVRILRKKWQKCKT